MLDANSSKPATPNSDARFATTRWTVVLAAGSPDSSRYREALETLCRTYWFPLYAYLRRTGSSTHEAEDYTQGFFTQMLEKQYLKDIEPEPGRFRSFLLVALKRFVSDQRARAHATKRGGSRKVLPLDFQAAEAQYALEPTHDLSPEKLFDKSWALALLEQTVVRLEEELADMGRKNLFESLKAYLGGRTDAAPYREIAANLDMTEDAVKSAVYRLRRRYREILRDEIAQTVATPQEADEEIRHLFGALAK